MKKKLIIRKQNAVYVTKDAEGAYCDFCGQEGVKVFESEWEHPMVHDPYHPKGGTCDMQICYDCVRTLNKFLLNSK